MENQWLGLVAFIAVVVVCIYFVRRKKKPSNNPIFPHRPDYDDKPKGDEEEENDGEG